MSVREVIFLGTASQVPTRKRNHNALFLRWDDLGILFDPGEGTQRQMVYAGIASTQITHIAITHFHGDHCLGLAALIQRISLDRVPHPIEIIYPKSGQVYFERLRYSSIYHDQAHLIPRPIQPATGMQVVAQRGSVSLSAHSLEHRVDCYGYRLQEQDSQRMLPEKLQEQGITGPQIRELIQKGFLEIEGKQVFLQDVSVPKKGQSFSLVMDTRPCEGAVLLAKETDLLVCESTYLSSESQEAFEHYHMTASQAATLAKQAQTRLLALTHFSQRYSSSEPFYEEAQEIFKDVIVAQDLTRIELPKRLEFP